MNIFWEKLAFCLRNKASVILPKYYGEDSHVEPTRYLTEVERQEKSLLIKEGRFYQHDGVTPAHTIHDIEDGQYGVAALYALGLDDEFYAVSKHSNEFFHQRLHHSTLFAGRPVRSAGFIQVDHGELCYISNCSGHYKPTLSSLLHSIYILRKKGIDLNSFQVWYESPESLRPVKYATALDFLREVPYPSNKDKAPLLVRLK